MKNGITGQKIAEIKKAFLDHFSEEDLEIYLLEKFDFSYEQNKKGDKQENRYFNLIHQFQQQNKLEDLLILAIEKRKSVSTFKKLRMEVKN